ncbi:GNAT family N-acetyltransferase [Anaerosoma tenue]|uniref:GNAT family N-acetyltransferase n=1 Tax=Anaerosoma tenue TaxID=2933588 RepID=UPI002260BB7F|nr:GNAT family N-acetyltransferase [Anaerosoma tenue]MCK8115846.1 GNAT family N-acetyltransferase [Anaerosoma tenue]
MTGRVFTDATAAQVDKLARALVAARVFPDEQTLRAHHRDRPWTIQVSGRGDVAVLDRWRDHLDLLGIDALWCPVRHIGDAVTHLSVCAAEHGFSGLVSPPVMSGDVPVYEAAGMRVRETLAVLELTPVSPAAVPGRPDVSMRPALTADAEEIIAIDGECFEPFWRYDLRLMRRFLDAGGVTLAERDGRCVGYTLSTVDRGSAVLGRLCVRASDRRVGIGSLLLEAAVSRARDGRARHMTLSARTGNAAALALYRSAGFADTGRRYAFLTAGDETGRGLGHRIGSLMGR